MLHSVPPLHMPGAGLVPVPGTALLLVRQNPKVGQVHRSNVGQLHRRWALVTYVRMTKVMKVNRQVVIGPQRDRRASMTSA